VAQCLAKHGTFWLVGVLSPVPHLLHKRFLMKIWCRGATSKKRNYRGMLVWCSFPNAQAKYVSAFMKEASKNHNLTAKEHVVVADHAKYRHILKLRPHRLKTIDMYLSSDYTLSTSALIVCRSTTSQRPTDEIMTQKLNLIHHQWAGTVCKDSNQVHCPRMIATSTAISRPFFILF
jgi:hypothetical protein